MSFQLPEPTYVSSHPVQHTDSSTLNSARGISDVSTIADLFRSDQRARYPSEPFTSTVMGVGWGLA
eukprot:CAMPEP_0180118312 /NCGR_PEP_ID=MMETSP0986-20121125/1390_1 /TAXON_ID=697907 /ORGANISM="non described non described, Strain CCMP2293" /LENGTH=65 /DNA_ID=CAMNT_0022057255 /DNA_START=267 /DNA_END=461 /DNA_ORIENTATION=+